MGFPSLCPAPRPKNGILFKASKLIGAGLASIGVLGSGIGIGTLFAGLLNSTARNPFLREELFRLAILGFALTEAIALFSLMITFIILFS